LIVIHLREFEMKKLAFAFVAVLCLSTVSLTGCGSGSSKVIEAPPADDGADAVQGMSDEDYNAEMEKSMSQQGN
jgi:predicted small lipoprotein YifL